MLNNNTDKRIKNLKKTMQKSRGYVSEAWEYAADKDIDFQEAYENLYTLALGPGKFLPIKTRELIAIAILAYRSSEDGVYQHMKRAIENGATIQELYEAIETTIIPGGAPTYGTGLRALMKIEKEKKK